MSPFDRDALDELERKAKSEHLDSPRNGSSGYADYFHFNRKRLGYPYADSNPFFSCPRIIISRDNLTEEEKAKLDELWYSLKPKRLRPILFGTNGHYFDNVPGYQNVIFHSGNCGPGITIKLQGKSTGKTEQARQVAKYFFENHFSIIDSHMEKNETKIPQGTYQIRPNHYGGADNPLEARKIIDHYGLGFNLGNVVKYVLRCGKKDSRIQELRKAMTYLEFEIEKELADMDSASSVLQEPTESVWRFDTLGVRVAKVNSLITSIGHEAAIVLYEKEITLLDKESPKNHFKINQCFEAMAAIKKKFHEFKPKFEEQSNAYNLSIGPDLEDASKDVIPCAQKLANALDALGFKIDSIEEMITKLNEMKLLHVENINDIKVCDDLLSIRFGLPYVSGGFRFARLMRDSEWTERWFVLTGPENRMFFELGNTTITDVTHSFKELYPKEMFSFGVSNLIEVSSGKYISPSSIHDRDKEIENTGERV